MKKALITGVTGQVGCPLCLFRKKKGPRFDRNGDINK